jgi:hypothetical protein
MDTSKDISPQALKRLSNYTWPGNIRELKNAIDRAVAFSDHSRLQPEDFDFLNSSPPSNAAPATDSGLSTPGHALLWENFERNGFKLWRFLNEDDIRLKLANLLEESRYIKKGHTGRIITPSHVSVEVPIEFLCPTSKKIEQLTIHFHFHPGDTHFRHLPVNHSTEVVHQDVLKGLPDTYLFKLLFPHGKAASTNTKTIQALVLRYVLEHASEYTLKAVFQQLMPPLINEDLALKTDGLRINGQVYTGTDALRAYLCSKQQLFYGIASEIKRNPDAIFHRIEEIFPDYKRQQTDFRKSLL